MICEGGAYIVIRPASKMTGTHTIIIAYGTIPFETRKSARMERMRRRTRGAPFPLVTLGIMHNLA